MYMFLLPQLLLHMPVSFINKEKGKCKEILFVFFFLHQAIFFLCSNMKLIKDEINILCSSTKLPRKLATTQRKKTSGATERGRPRVVDVRGQLQSTPTKPQRERVTIQTGNHRGDWGGGFIQTGNHLHSAAGHHANR